MAQYDWISSNEFQTLIRTHLEQRLAESKIAGLPYTTSEALAKIAKENQPELEERLKRSLVTARNMDDALVSLDKIIRTAIANVQSEKRTTVTMDDVTASIKANFCSVWPFCK